MKGKKYARFDFFDIHSEKIKKTNSWNSMFKIIKQNKQGRNYHIIQDTDSL